MTFDMKQCKPGDILICRDGSIAIYADITTYFRRRYMEDYPHNLYDAVGDFRWSVTDSGQLYKDIMTDRDVVGFYLPNGEDIAKYKEAFEYYRDAYEKSQAKLDEVKSAWGNAPFHVRSALCDEYFYNVLEDL